MEYLCIFLMMFGFHQFGFKSIHHDANPKANLVCNPSFEQKANSWNFYLIKADAVGEIDSTRAVTGRNSYEFKENSTGEGFLHSCVFDVKPQTKYSVSIQVKGTGNFQVQLLWWKKYDSTFIDESARHLNVAMKGEGTNRWKKLESTVVSPSDAHKAYIRLVASAGNVWVDDVNIH